MKPSAELVEMAQEWRDAYLDSFEQDGRTALTIVEQLAEVGLLVARTCMEIAEEHKEHTEIVTQIRNRFGL